MTEPHDQTTPASPPRRTCVGCRQIDAQSALWRAIVDAAGRLQLQLQRGDRRQPGRGAYVHRRAACLVAATRGGFARSFRRAVSGGDGDRALRMAQAALRSCITEQNPVGNWDQDNNS